MRIAWGHGVSVESNRAKIILDPQNNCFNCSGIFVSHAHRDHSEAFNSRCLSKFSSEETKELVSAYGMSAENWQPLPINKKVLIDGIEVISHNSGHILGSYEFEVNTPEGNVLYTGDINTEDTKTTKSAEPISCDILIIESTFGAPNFVFPSEELIAEEMKNWAEKILKQGKIPTFQTDPLGNAQEIISIFNEYTSIPVVAHRRVSEFNRVYESYNYKLEYINAVSGEADDIISSGNMVFITPKQLNLQDHPEFVPALVSGWALWSKRKAFPLSDHADFSHLMRFIEDCNPKIVLTCHGGWFNETLARYVERELKIRAYPIHLIPTSVLPES